MAYPRSKLLITLIFMCGITLHNAHAQEITQLIQLPTLEQELDDATGIKMLDSGKIMVTSSHNGSLVILEGDQINKIKLGAGVFDDSEPTGIDRLPNGNMVIVSEGNHNIAIVKSKDYSLINKFSKSGDDAGELDKPRSVAVSVNHKIYVAEQDNKRVSVFNDQGLFLYFIGNHDVGSDLNKPAQIALDAEENVYVLETGENFRVNIYTSKGKLIKSLNKALLKQSIEGSIDISAMTVDLNGVVYLANEDSMTIFSYDWRNEKLLNQFGSLGQSRGQYRDISYLSVNNQSQLAVLDTTNKKIEVYQLEQPSFDTPIKTNILKFAQVVDQQCESLNNYINEQYLCVQENGIKVLSTDGKVVGDFAMEVKDPVSLHVGREMIAVLEKKKVHGYSLSGKKLYSVGRYGSAPGAFDGAKYVYSAHNQIYVGDVGNNRIQIFAADGQFVTQIKAAKNTFDTVGPMAVDSQQNLYIADPGSKGLIRVLNKYFEQYADIGYLQDSSHQAKKIHSLDLDRQDRLYALVSSDVNKYSVRMFDAFNQIEEFGAGSENETPVFFEQASSLSVASSDKNIILVNDVERKKIFSFHYYEIPEAAFGLRVIGNKESVKLEWDSTRSPLIAHYEIQGADNEQGSYQTLATTSDLSKTFTLSETQAKSWFRIVAVSGFKLNAKSSSAQENQFYRLQLLHQAKQYEAVIPMAEKLLKTDPDNADILHLKAESELFSGKQHAALISFRKLEKYPAYKSIAIRQQVRAYFELEQYLDAKALIEQVLAEQPKEVYPYLVCAELSIKLNDAISAVTCAEDGLYKHEQHTRLRYLLGKAYIMAGINDQGMEEYQRVLDAASTDSAIRLQIAHDYMEMSQFDLALAQYEALSKAPHKLTPAMIGQAKALLSLNRDDEAKAIAIKLSGGKDSKGEGYYVLGKIAAKQEKYTEAVLRLTRASKVKPDNVDSWISLAAAYVSLNKPVKAVTSLTQGITANPERFELYEMAGRLELEQEHFPEASGYLDKAVTLQSQSLNANKLYARSLFSSRNYRSAAKYAERAAKISPKDIDVLTLQADIASQQGKVGSAIEYLKTAIDMQPASPELQLQIGKVYQNANLFDASRQHLEKAASINPSWAQPLVALGHLFSKRRQFDEAIASFEKAVELEPSDNNRALLNGAFSDKKKSLDFKNNAPQLVLSDLNLKHVFSAAYKQYADQPIGSVQVKNVSATDYGNLQLSFQIKEYMDFPVTQEIPSIKGDEVQDFQFKVTFNNKILEVDEDIGVQVEVKLSFQRDGIKDDIRLTQPMTIYGKNAMVWGQAEMVGSFVTPKDDTLRNYVRTVINKYQPKIGPLNDKLVSAMTFFSSLNAAGTKYIIDPNTPYTSLRDDQVDYVQFPRETLKLKSGDCDDLSVLLSAGLENLGIETVLLEVPGHLLMMFNTGLDEIDAGLISQDRSLLATHNGQVWVPIESTMVHASFNEAWAEGARKYHKAVEQNQLGVIELKKAWQSYKPVTLSKATYSIDLPDESQTLALVDHAQTQLLTKSINRLILPFQSMIENNPKNIDARLQIAILYSRFGLTDEAQLAFDALLEASPENSAVHNNQGSLYLLEGEFDKAITSFQQAAELDNKDGGIWVNLSMAFYQKGDASQAASHFQQALVLNPEFKTRYAAYQKLLSQ